MALAWLLTLLALVGAAAGVFVGRSGKISAHLSAAGGGLLFGIAIFWLIPETAETIGWAKALIFALACGSLLALLDRALAHRGHSASQGVIWPLLLATTFHSLLDGWSIRALGVQPLTNVAATIGLALHKIPEGLALGWITRRTLGSARKAFLVSSAAELFTLAGGFAEPIVNSSGAARFGVWWTAGVLSVIAGGFLFLGLHAVEPAWKRSRVLATFLATFLAVGGLTMARSGLLH